MRSHDTASKFAYVIKYVHVNGALATESQTNIYQSNL